MTTITVPRETWDAMREALEEIICAHPVTSTMRQVHAIVAGRAAITAAVSVSHPKPETAPPPEGGAITSESDHFPDATKMMHPLGWYCVSRDGLATLCADLRDAEITAKSANRDWPNSAPYRAVQLCEFEAHPQATEPQAQGEAKTYAPSRQRVVMACDILDRIKEAHENWGGWSGTPSSCDAAINLLRYPANMPVNAAQPQATEPASCHQTGVCVQSGLAAENHARLVECARRLVEHADFALGGILSADSKAKDIPSKAVSQVKSRHLAALRDALPAAPEAKQ